MGSGMIWIQVNRTWHAVHLCQKCCKWVDRIEQTIELCEIWLGQLATLVLDLLQTVVEDICIEQLEGFVEPGQNWKDVRLRNNLKVDNGIINLITSSSIWMMLTSSSIWWWNHLFHPLTSLRWQGIISHWHTRLMYRIWPDKLSDSVSAASWIHIMLDACKLEVCF
jgi:hypothetical protein